MKLQIVSDLHLEFFKDPEFTGITPATGADALVIAGDIHVRTKAVEGFAHWPVPVIYVTGNHEFYSGHDLGKTVQELRDLCEGTSIRFLEKTALVVPGFESIRILGTALWTDYLLFGRKRQAESMRACQETLADHSRIRSQGRRFMARDAMFRHVAAKAWLTEQLAIPFDGKTVVITHHGCHMKSVGPRWVNDLVSAGFSSDMTTHLEQADLWIHGHTHESFDYTVGKCRVIVNPRGYPVRDGYENEDFDPNLIVEV